MGGLPLPITVLLPPAVPKELNVEGGQLPAVGAA